MKAIPRIQNFIALLFLFLLIAFVPACTPASSRESSAPPPPPALRNPHLRALVAEYDRFFSDSMLGSLTPGAAVVIVKDSTVIFQRGYGLKALNKVLDSVGVNTVFRIGSLSKGFAGVLTGMLVESGKLNWNDRVVRYVPAFALASPEHTGQVQLRHLLSHTTGLPYHAYTNMIEREYPLDSIVPRFKKLKLHGNPGEIFSYQNAAFSLIGKAMLRSTGKSFPKLLEQKIFKPAGMLNASADWASISRYHDLALPHRGSHPDSITPRFYNAAPAGGVNASISDMGEWLLLLLGYKPEIASKAVLDKVFEPVIRTGTERHRWAERAPAYYGMGWRILVSGTDTLVYHGGAVNDFRGEIAFHRRDGIGICVLFNASTSLSNTCMPVFWEMYLRRREVIQAWKDSLVD